MQAPPAEAPVQPRRGRSAAKPALPPRQPPAAPAAAEEHDHELNGEHERSTSPASDESEPPARSEAASEASEGAAAAEGQPELSAEAQGEADRAAELQLALVQQPAEEPGGEELDKEELSELDDEDEADYLLSCACCCCCCCCCMCGCWRLFWVWYDEAAAAAGADGHVGVCGGGVLWMGHHGERIAAPGGAAADGGGGSGDKGMVCAPSPFACHALLGLTLAICKLHEIGCMQHPISCSLSRTVVMPGLQPRQPCSSLALQA